MEKRKIRHIGEKGFLKTILPDLSKLDRDSYLVPPGDDAAVLKNRGGNVLSIDGLVDGVHFRSSWRQKCEKKFKLSFGRALGWKAMGSALSDLAAMGDVRSRWCLVFLGVPLNTSLNFLSDFYRGLKESTRRYDCLLAGGDTVRSSTLVVTVAVGGALCSRAVQRTGSEAGDFICVAGRVGEAAVGLEILENKRTVKPPLDQYFVRRFFEHQPLFQVGKLLAGNPGVKAMIDMSDSLHESLEWLLEGMALGAQIDLDMLPLSPQQKELDLDRRLMMGGGEDYGLLFTMDPQQSPALRKGLKFTVIGRVEPIGSGIQYYCQGKLIRPPRFFRHFSKAN